MISLDPVLFAAVCIGCAIAGAAAAHLISRRYQPTGTTPAAVARLLHTVQLAMADNRITPDEAGQILRDVIAVLKSLVPSDKQP